MLEAHRIHIRNDYNLPNISFKAISINSSKTKQNKIINKSLQYHQYQLKLL